VQFSKDRFMKRSLSSIAATFALFVFVVYGQVPNERSTVPHNAIVEIHLDKHAYTPGEEINVSLILKPAGDGIYIDKIWGEAGGNIPGFRISMTTVAGRNVQRCGSGSVADYVADTTTPSQWLDSEFMYLPAGRFIGWETSVRCPPTEQGKYLLKARYEPNNHHTLGVATLPQAQGRVLTNTVESQPVEVEIQ
jgi:hypothetical protein